MSRYRCGNVVLHAPFRRDAMSLSMEFKTLSIDDAFNVLTTSVGRRQYEWRSHGDETT